jgi:hypothetical protein
VVAILNKMFTHFDNLTTNLDIYKVRCYSGVMTVLQLYRSGVL